MLCGVENVFTLPVQCVRTSTCFFEKPLCWGKEAREISGGKITTFSGGPLDGPHTPLQAS